MNKKLLKANRETLSPGEQVELKEQVLSTEIQNNKEYTTNHQLAIIFNILAENLNLLKESEHKAELVKFLEHREQVKENYKGE